MPRTAGDDSRSNVRRYRKKLSSTDKPGSRYILKERQATNDWACIPQSRRRVDEPDLHPEEQVVETRRSRRMREAYHEDDHGDYYEPDYEPDEDYEPEVIPRRARSASPRRYRPADILSLRAMAATALIILAAAACGMVAENQFGMVSAVVAGLVTFAGVVAGWFAPTTATTLVGGGIVILIGAWMIAKAIRLNRSYYEPPPRRRVMVSKETLDRYF